jgi:hypothetical protein
MFVRRDSYVRKGDITMASTVQVESIQVLQPVISDCPTTITVVIINRGSDQTIQSSADEKFEVCLESEPPFEGEAHVHQRVLGREQHLKPGERKRIEFPNIKFRPFNGPQVITATADDCSIPPGSPPKHEVSNNNSVNRSLSTQISVLNAPRLSLSSLNVGLDLGSGHIKWWDIEIDRFDLCPGADLVVEAAITNVGHATANASVTELSILDSIGTVLSTIRQNTPSIAPSKRVQLTFIGPGVNVPNLPGSDIEIRVCADADGVVQPTCDRNSLCSSKGPLTIAGASMGPGLICWVYGVDNNGVITTDAGGPIVPGQPILMSWELRNNCSDLGQVTARVSFKNTLLYPNASNPNPPPIPIGRYDTHSDNIDLPIPSAVEDDFYQLGTKKLHLEITGLGSDPGPYSYDAPITVRGLVDESWWSWEEPTGGATLPWGKDYSVMGALTNKGKAIIEKTTKLRLTQVDDGAVPPLLGYPADPNLTQDTAPILSLPPQKAMERSWNEKQTWKWVAPPAYILVGPFDKKYHYSVAFELDDEYGNSYAQISSALSILVSVPIGKRLMQLTAEALVLAAVGLAAAAIAALLTGQIPLATELAGLATSSYTGAKLAYEQAIDPPYADFRYHEVVTIAPAEVPWVQQESSSFDPLRSVLELIHRILAARYAQGQIHCRLIGARIDNNLEGIRLQVAAYRSAERVLLQCATHLPGTVSAAADTMRNSDLFAPAKLSDMLNNIRREGVPHELHEQLAKSGLAGDALAAFEAVLREGPELQEFIWTYFERIAEALTSFAHEVKSETPDILASAAE